jgi:hypothetical protein
MYVFENISERELGMSHGITPRTECRTDISACQYETLLILPRQAALTPFLTSPTRQ